MIDFSGMDITKHSSEVPTDSACLAMSLSVFDTGVTRLALQDKLFSPSPQATSLPNWFREHAVSAHMLFYLADVLRVFRDQWVFKPFSRFA
jgi:hypothetical protein